MGIAEKYSNGLTFIFHRKEEYLPFLEELEFS